MHRDAGVQDDPKALKNSKTGRWKSLFFGDYDYGYLCRPVWPYCQEEKRMEAPFYSLNQHLGIITAIILGGQHMVAMMSGVIVPPILIGGMCPTTDTSCSSQKVYLIQVRAPVTRVPLTIWAT